MNALPVMDPCRFRILRPLDRGGISRVFVAYDEELNREVALKQLRRRYADRIRSRSRFLFEAEVTAGLEHPGVVPVYGMGQFADRRTFFTMRLIRGETLRGAIKRAHSTGKPRGTSPELRTLLDRLVDVCYTVAYAHSRGIIHRDLTPGNIMLGAHGETLVIDWGLAKPIGRPSPLDEGDSAQEVPWPATARTLPRTRVGHTSGTTWYMSPEQASGDSDRLGPATDVYTLGATLYMVLTGQAPFDGPDEDEVQKLVQCGALVAPRRINRKIAPALEAICLKAMAMEPGDRYVSPLDLGDDIACWLARRPLKARPVTAAREWLVEPAIEGIASFHERAAVPARDGRSYPAG
ncbi:serine/threonine-protein kinase [Singulisphaera sp. Ch08]|uniref:Serine/threonine-protein kinase n=1 Tax=Singulisphaera sp. Ch08 TaxID=3120278 RepID=A0AAU7CG68_9BACT